MLGGDCMGGEGELGGCEVIFGLLDHSTLPNQCHITPLPCTRIVNEDGFLVVSLLQPIIGAPGR